MTSSTMPRDYSKIKGKIRLGLCCINTELRAQKPPVFCSRTMTRKNFTVEKAKKLSMQNVQDITTMIEWNEEHNIKCFRLSSDMFPHFTDKETEPYTIDFAKKELKKAGDLAKKYGHRIVMHPGQYNQVGSKSKDVFEQTIKDLSHHADILDAMGIDMNGILIVHGGGIYGDKPKTIKRWISNFSKLPEKVKRRLVIENDEKCYSIKDCLHISEKTGIPVVFDSHHYECYQNYHKLEPRDIKPIMKKVFDTWTNKELRPLCHISNQAKDKKVGCHSDFITEFHSIFFDMCEDGFEFDLEIEAKMKEQAIFKLRKLFPQAFC